MRDELKRRGPAVLTLASVLLIATSLGYVVVCAGRGLDVTDEGFYLVSYRWWDVNFDNFTGAQYFFGPVFEILGFDVARLRIFRIVALIATHACFGACFMAWLRARRPDAAPGRWWAAAGITAITTCSAAVYSWLPLTAGYNDLALMCSLLLAGGVLLIARAQEAGRRPAAWVPVVLGAVAVVLVLSKWSSSLVVLVGVLVTLLTVHVCTRRGWRELAYVGALTAAGVLVALAFINFALVPLGTLLPPLLEVNRLVAESTNSPTLLLATYRDGFVDLVGDVLRLHWLLLLTAAALPWLRRRPVVGTALVAVATLVTAVQVIRTDGYLGGPVHSLIFPTTFYTPLFVAAVLAISLAVHHAAARDDDRPDPADPAGEREDAADWRPRVAHAALLVMILGMPFAQAAGTGNWIHKLAVIGVGFWMAALIHLLTGLDGDLPAGRLLVGTMAAVLAMTTTTVAASAVWSYPYRTTGHAVSNVPSKLPALSSLQLSRADERDFEKLRKRLAPYLRHPGRPIIAFDRMAGVALALQARPVGESWYSVTAPDRSRAGIVRTCEDGPWWTEDRKPIVLFNRDVAQADLDALAECDIRLEGETAEPNYRFSKMKFRGVPLQIWVPER